MVPTAFAAPRFPATPTVFSGDPPDCVRDSELPATRNTSPMVARIHRIELHLTVVHRVFCHCPATCHGIRPIRELLQGVNTELVEIKPPLPNQCAQAMEAEELLQFIYLGFPLTHLGRDLTSLEPIRCAEYPCNNTDHLNEIITDLETAYSGGLSFRTNETPQFCSPTFAKPEKSKTRIIRDYSATDKSLPEHLQVSVNDLSGHKHFSLTAERDVPLTMIPFGVQYVNDIKAAYKQIGILPQHWGLQTTMDPRGGFAVHTRAEFGHAANAEHCVRITTAISACMAAYGYPQNNVFVDDFRGIERDQPAADTAQQTLIYLLKDWAMPDSAHKRQQGTSIKYLGCIDNTNTDGEGAMSISVAPEKLCEAEKLAQQLSTQYGHITTRKLRHTIGVLSSIARPIYTARTFLRRLIYALADAEKQQKLAIPITNDMRWDFHWWATLAKTFNGQGILVHRNTTWVEGTLFTDASNLGMGGFLILPDKSYKTFSIAWADLPAALTSLNPEKRKFLDVVLTLEGTPEAYIGYRELFTLHWALILWGDNHINNCFYRPQLDNVLAVAAARNLTTAYRPAMRLVRALALLLVHLNTRIDPAWIPTAENFVADAASRLQSPAILQAAIIRHLHLTPPAPPPPPTSFQHRGLSIHRFQS